MAYPEYISYGMAIARGEAGATVTTLNAYCDTMSNTANGFILAPYNLYAPTAPAVSTATSNYVRVSSSDANDVSSGSGVQQVTIHGVGPDGSRVSENITCTGQTPNTSTNIYVAINSVVCLTCGSGGINAGDIYITDNVDSTTAGVPDGTSTAMQIMAAGDGKSTMLRYLVPSSFTAYMVNVVTGENNSTHNTTFRAWQQAAGASQKQLLAKSTGQKALAFDIPPRIGENTYIWVDGVAGASATTADVILEIALFTGD